MCAGGVACLLCAVTSAGLQRVWALAGRFGAASALSLAQLYTAELLSSDVQHGALIATAQVSVCFTHASCRLSTCAHHSALALVYGLQLELELEL